MPIDMTDESTLKASIAGKSDHEIAELGNGSPGGIVGILDQMFDRMAASFNPDAAAGKSAILQYEIALPDGSIRPYTFRVADGKCELDKAATDSARMTMTIAFADWLRLATKELDGMSAFMSGSIKIRGDLMFAQTTANWFGAA